MDEDTVHVRGGILFSPEKEGGPAIRNNMEEPGGYYSKRSQSREDKCYVILLMGYPKQSNSQAGSPSFNYELSTIVMYCRITCIHRYKINETLETTDQHKESSFLLFLFDVSFCSQQNAVAPRAALPTRRKPGPKQLWPVSPWLPPAPQDLGQGPSY